MGVRGDDDVVHVMQMSAPALRFRPHGLISIPRRWGLGAPEDGWGPFRAPWTLSSSARFTTFAPIDPMSVHGLPRLCSSAASSLLLTQEEDMETFRGQVAQFGTAPGMTLSQDPRFSPCAHIFPEQPHRPA